MHAQLTRADARANRARLIEAAVAVLAEDGPNADMRQIAARAGVSTGTLYRNFPTKADLVAAMAAASKEQLQEVVRQAAAKDDLLSAIRSLLEGGFAVSQRFGVLAALAGSDRERREQLRHGELNEQVLAGVGALIRRGMAAGLLRGDLNVDFTALRLLSLFEPRLVRQYGRRWPVDQLVELSVDFFFHGAGALAGASGEDA